MPKTAIKADFQALKRRQMDDRISRIAHIDLQAPRGGWIRTVRTALGMSNQQLAHRLGQSRQAVAQFERNEARGAITLAKLREVADAMDCDVVLALRPRAGSVEETVRLQAVRKAERLHDSVVHTMALEGQSAGVPRAPTAHVDIEWWVRENARRLWDE